MLSVLTIIYFCFSLANSQQGRPSNTCSSFVDYLFMSISPNCFNHPDVSDPVSTIVTRYGYPYEEMRLETGDGYFLKLIRLPNPGKRPVLMVHGFLLGVNSWFLLTNNSLPFRLYDAGYDLWLASFRGNYYSHEHANESISQKDYWDFSFHEMGDIDIPLMINYILKITQSPKKIIYIGHSMGGSAGLIYTILHREEAKRNIEILVLATPTIYLRYSNYKILSPIMPIFRKVSTFFNIYHIGFYSTFARVTFLDFCINQFTRNFCYTLANIFYGYTDRAPYPEEMAVYLSHAIPGNSIKTANHYTQICDADGNFQFYDYGKEKNLDLYGSESPPGYDVRLVNVPVDLYYGRGDRLTIYEDAMLLYNRLTTKKRLTIIETGDNEEPFAHIDFISGRYVDYFYKPLFRNLEKLEDESSLSKNNTIC